MLLLHSTLRVFPTRTPPHNGVSLAFLLTNICNPMRSAGGEGHRKGGGNAAHRGGKGAGYPAGGRGRGPRTQTGKTSLLPSLPAVLVHG